MHSHCLFLVLSLSQPLPARPSCLLLFVSSHEGLSEALTHWTVDVVGTCFSYGEWSAHGHRYGPGLSRRVC